MRTSSNSSHTPHNIIALIEITKYGLCGTCGAIFDFKTCIARTLFQAQLLQFRAPISPCLIKTP